MLVHQALSISNDLFLPSEADGCILSVHGSHLNLAMTEGIVTLLRCGDPLIPFGIEVAGVESWYSLELQQGCPVVYKEGRLFIGDKAVVEGISTCSRYSNRPRANRIFNLKEIGRRLSLLDQLCRETPKSGGIMDYLGHYRFEEGIFKKGPAEGVLKREIGRRFELLLAGIARNDDFLISEGVHGFLGLGPGMTPSGDDFLVGFLCGITFLHPEACRPANIKLAQYLAQEAPVLTTALSAEYIKYAAFGSYHAYFLNLLQALCQGDEDEIITAGNAMLSLGHYSGTDLLLGFVYGGMSAIQLSRGDIIDDNLQCCPQKHVL